LPLKKIENMRKYLLIILFWIGALAAYSSHQRAGEITFVHVSGNTYQFTITTYTYTPSSADRPEIPVFWGDGTGSIIERLSKTDLANNISKNVYAATHTFAAAGSYTISFEDIYRNAGILNIPNSFNIPFYIQTTLIINPFLGSNSSPQLLNPPIDNGCTNVIYYHNPGAYDADGDSLSYSLITCKGYDGEDIPGYSMPQASNSLTINPITGDLIWDTPLTTGEYNIAILIKEWRQGILIGTITRDMQITISPCDNRPPEIHTIINTCISADDTLTFEVVGTDLDLDNVRLEAFSATFFIPSPAYFPTVNGAVPLTASFFWATNYNHVKRNAYSVLFKATDNGSPVNLTAFKTVNITVIAPKPENLTATAVGNQIELRWQPSICTNIVGYKVFKRAGSYPFTPAHCETGLPAYAGYTLIGTTANTTFTDDGSVMPIYNGNEYYYRVYALFADGSESYVSDEAYCFDYRFPNMFTPNNDGYNDLFTPYPHTNVSKVKFVTYNRWGSMVYKTENPDVNWDGVHILTKKPVPDGTYYFTCDVYVTTMEGKEQIVSLNGTILLVRDAK
jgi:gliding motility-associated-like protein